MDFEEWEPVYEAILADFGYPRSGDERARDALAGLADDFEESRLDWIDGASVAIAGAGPSLERNLPVARRADATIAASTAADRLLAEGVPVDLQVTDLDKRPDTTAELSHRGVPVAVHAHGDNVPAVREVVPTCTAAQVLPTTQAAPAGPVRNFGGFTDGDRAAFLADHFGAEELRFVGWDLDDRDVDPKKRRKLAWAERLLYWLERRRGERFPVLAGRRDAIDTAALAVDSE